MKRSAQRFPSSLLYLDDRKSHEEGPGACIPDYSTSRSDMFVYNLFFCCSGPPLVCTGSILFLLNVSVQSRAIRREWREFSTCAIKVRIDVGLTSIILLKYI